MLCDTVPGRPSVSYDPLCPAHRLLLTFYSLNGAGEALYESKALKIGILQQDADFR